LAPPQNSTGNGLAGGTCTPNIPNGTTTEYEEGVDIDQTRLNGGGPYGLIDGGIKSIDPTRLPRDPYDHCNPVYPWNFVRTNTIYGVIHAAHGYTAWSDKHPVYAAVSGPGQNAGNVDDYYSPEVNSMVIALPGVSTASGSACSSIRDTSQTGSWTDSFKNIQCYDALKVNAILHQIDGKTHDGTRPAPVPTLFGMNFQAVSVGEKLIKPSSADRTDTNSGGYEDAQGTPRPKMLAEIQFVDAAIGQMVAALKSQGLLHKTVIIITAKHGQSPIDPNRFFPIPGSTGNNGKPPSAIISALLPAVFNDPNNALGIAEDDISQLWLADSNHTNDAVTALENAGTTIGLGQILYDGSLTTLFNPPGVPIEPGPCCAKLQGGDPRTPDIVVLPNVGVVYTGGLKKQSEHGGFAWDDTNVMLLVSNPRIEARTIHSFVETAQVAPTILQILGLHRDALDAVRHEGTPVLPGLDH
jgi:Type I phosphodiesterase / nucleotide pyrophosphatase